MSNLTIGGFSGWRMPAIDELAAIYDPAQDVGGWYIKGGVSKPHSGTLDIRPGGHGGPAMTANEVNAVGGLRVYTCPAGYAAVDSADKLLVKGVVDLYACKNVARLGGGFVHPTCDPAPDDYEQACHVKKMKCNKNIYDWCELQFGKEGTQQNLNNRAKYDSCVTANVDECTSSQTQCMANIRRCGSGQTCDARTEVCFATPR